jgi:hypothetical protein
MTPQEKITGPSFAYQATNPNVSLGMTLLLWVWLLLPLNSQKKPFPPLLSLRIICKLNQWSGPGLHGSRHIWIKSLFRYYMTHKSRPF